MASLQSSSRQRRILKHFFCYCGVAGFTRGERRHTCKGVSFLSWEQPSPAVGQQTKSVKLFLQQSPSSTPTFTSLIQGVQEACRGRRRQTPRSTKLRYPSDTRALQARLEWLARSLSNLVTWGAITIGCSTLRRTIPSS